MTPMVSSLKTVLRRPLHKRISNSERGPGAASVYVDVQCDERSHLFPVTELSVTRPLQQTVALILTADS